MKRLLLLVWLGFSVGSVGADPSKSGIGPRLLLGDRVRFNRPVVVGVPVSNYSSKSEPCHIRINESYNSSVSGETSLDIAPGSQHIVPVIAPAGAYYQMLISVDQPNHPSKPTTLQGGNPLSDVDVLALVFAPVGSEFDYLGGYKGPDFYVSHVPHQNPLPTHFSPYLAGDLIILYDLPRLNLSPQVEEALAQWTRLGGTLVMVSPQAEAEYRGTPLETLVPTPANWQPLVSPTSRRKGPLAWLRPADQGQVVLITEPVIDQKRLGNDDSFELWSLIVHNLRNNCNFSRLRFEDIHRLAHPAELPKPSAAGIAWYLVAYVLVITPINYWWLKRRDKMLWLIVTVPVISTSIASMSFALNSIGHSSDIVVRELGLACLSNHSASAVLDHSLMLFSPGSYRFKIDISKDSYLRPLDNMFNSSGREVHFVNGNEGGYFRDYAVPMWSLARFRNLALRSLAGPIDVELGPLSGHSRRLVIDNRSGVTLQHCCYHDGPKHQISQFFDIGPGLNSITAEMVAGSDADSLALPHDGKLEIDGDDLKLLVHQKESLLPSGVVGWTTDPHLASEVRLEEPRRPTKRYSLTAVFLETEPRPLPPPPARTKSHWSKP